MEKDNQKNIVNHFEPGSNCQLFYGNNTGCVFAMPGSTVTQQAATAVRQKDRQPEVVIPSEVGDSEAWQKLKAGGLVDADGQPTVSRPEAALIADTLAERLGITNKWKFFEKLWHRNNIRGDFNTALNQRKSLKFQERLKKILD